MLIFCLFMFFFLVRLKKMCFFFPGCLKTDGFEFHNFEIIHYLVEENEDLIGP